MARFCSLIALAWIDEMLRNFLWVPLTAYARDLKLGTSSLGTMFAANVGMRFFPNLLVTQIGARAELLMMSSVCIGYLTSFKEPKAHWSLYCLALLSGMGFARPCVTLHAQVACRGDVDSLSTASRYCGSARTFADVCSFVLPAALFDLAGWPGVTLFGASLALAYLFICVPLYLRECRLGTLSGEFEMDDFEQLDPPPDAPKGIVESMLEVPRVKPKMPIPWIDWAMSAAFVSTELQWNLLNTAVPAALVRSYGYPASTIGLTVGLGSLVAFFYLLALPSLPRVLRPPRPRNLLMTYTGMSCSWIVMLGALLLRLPAAVFIAGSYLFLCMANASQIVLIECLTGVCDLAASTRIMGVSEMVGCALGMLGSYAGEALLVFGVPAPFILCGQFSVFSSVFLAFALGRRRTQIREHVAAEDIGFGEPAGPQPTAPLERSVEGLRSILVHSETYISDEITFRNKVVSVSRGASPLASTSEARREGGLLLMQAGAMDRDTPMDRSLS